jgi:hypothetical protein
VTLGQGNIALATFELATALALSLVSLLFPILAGLALAAVMVAVIWIWARRSRPRREAHV